MLQGHRQAEVSSAIVPNPYFSPSHEISFGNPKHVTAAVNVKESAVSSLAGRGVLEQHQVAAADRFRAHYEALCGLRGSPIRERVDGGKTDDSFTDRHAEAGLELRKARVLLGRRGYRLAELVCGEGRHFSEICRDQRQRNTSADCLRALLDDLSWLWGYRR